MKDCGCNGEKQGNFFQNSLVKLGKSMIKYVVDPSYSAFVSREESDRRMKICGDCEYREDTTGGPKCSLCKCFLGAKTRLSDQDCPYPNGSKWHENKES